MYQKFIINQGRLKLGVVDQHRHIAEDHSTTSGGGWWHMELKARRILLYGKSVEFGSVASEVLQNVILEGKHDYPDFTFMHSKETSLEDALETAVPLN